MVSSSAMMAFMSFSEALVAFSRRRERSVRRAMMLATVVLPVPEGP